MYFDERPPNLEYINFEDPTQLKRYRDYIVVEVWFGTKRQKQIIGEIGKSGVDSLIVYSIPKELFVE
jgi:hypothetical protein